MDIGEVGASCLLAMWNEAFLQKWDSLLDHMLLSHRIPGLGKIFRQACREGRTALAMTILEEHVNDHDDTLSLAVEREETVELLLWMDRKGIPESNGSEMDATVVVAPWLKHIRSKLEDMARRPSADPTTLHVTLSGIRAAAHYPLVFDPVHPRRAPLRQAAGRGDTEHPYPARSGGRFLVDKIRHSLRTAPRSRADHAAHFVKALSLCLETACSLRRPKEAETAVVDSLPGTVQRDHEAVVSLLLAHPDLPTSGLYPALVRACEWNNEHMIRLLLTHPDLDVHLDTGTTFWPRLRINEGVRKVLNERRDDRALRPGHMLVTSALVTVMIGTLRGLLQDPRFDAGSGLMALKLAIRSEKPKVVMEVLSAERYAETFRAGREDPGVTALSINGNDSVASEIVKILTEFTIQMVLVFWGRDASMLPTMKIQKFKDEIMQREREIFEMLKRFLLTGWVDPKPLKQAIAEETKLGKPWQDAVDFLRVLVRLQGTNQSRTVSIDRVT
ncbi:hypothetical protein HDU96_000459 [Phlyctochytrium bullatum]|nr:hypothetical protein HDU96_000459 [Phlyctochytrium bullatum]